MPIIFDVGANWGTDSLPKVELDLSLVCHAFEPTYELVRHLYSKSAHFRERYIIHPIAISDFDGKATFNVAPLGDWGVSSLNEFADDIEKTWPGREDLKVTSTVEVDVYRLETLFKLGALPVQEIEFFHCDVQGSDLKALQGMANYVRLIKHGCIEVPMSEGVKLYKDQHSKEDVISFLNHWGFEIYEVQNQMNEQNLFYRRK